MSLNSNDILSFFSKELLEKEVKKKRDNFENYLFM